MMGTFTPIVLKNNVTKHEKITPEHRIGVYLGITTLNTVSVSNHAAGH